MWLTPQHIGYKAAGFIGSIIGTIGVLFVPTLLAITLSIYFYKFKDQKWVERALRGVRPAVLGIIAAACFSIGKVSFVDYKSIIIGAIVLLTVYKFKPNPILVIFASGILGLIIYSI